MEKIIIFGTGRRLDWLIEYKCLRGGGNNCVLRQ